MIALLLTANTLLYTLRLTTPVGSFPKPLSAKEEQYYLARWAEGDLEARNILVERNLRLVAHILKKYYASSADQDDLISIGTIGLIKAISTFDGSKGARLATYAGRCIQNEILMYFRSQRKSAGDISLSDAIETGQDGSSLSVMDVLSSDEDLFQQTHLRSETKKLMGLLDRTLTSRDCLVPRPWPSVRWRRNWGFPGAMCRESRKKPWKSCEMPWRSRNGICPRICPGKLLNSISQRTRRVEPRPQRCYTISTRFWQRREKS